MTDDPWASAPPPAVADPFAAQHAAAAMVECPPGWQRAFDVRHQVNYYYHVHMRQRQWEWPAPPPAATLAADPLPPPPPPPTTAKE
eukprot:12769762-Alexandrium_andersonii.AAC.1